MLRILLATLVSLLAALPAAAQAPLEAGDQLPLTVIDGLSQTDARSFSDFYGRTVLLEFFAHWCAPCAASVPHLNELQETYGPRGLSVVAVTTENAKKTEPWIARQKAKYAYGYDTQGALQRAFQYRGIPFAALIDPFGTVIWTGHPLQLEPETIEKALSGVLEPPVLQWPEAERALARMLERGEFANALQEGAKLAPRAGFDLQDLVRGRFLPLVAKFAGFVERSEYPEAFKLGEWLEKGLAGLPDGEQLSTRLNALRADPEVMRQVKATARLAELEARAGALKKPADAEQLRTEVSAFLTEKPGQKFERRAQILLDALERGLQRVKKP